MPAERTSCEAGGALGDELVERLAGDVLHDDVGFFGVTGFCGSLADVVDGADVGVIDGGGETGFAELGGAHLLDGEVAALEELEARRGAGGGCRWRGTRRRCRRRRSCG